MKSGTILWVLCMLLVCSCALGGEGRSAWRTSHFDGHGFREGSIPEVAQVHLKDGFLPVVTASDVPLSEDPLPEGSGGIVIYCYLQSSGGKITAVEGTTPVPGVAVQVKRGGDTLLLRTDGRGFAVAGIPAGSYEFTIKGMSRPFTVEKGATTLLPVRVGKRMVD